MSIEGLCSKQKVHVHIEATDVAVMLLTDISTASNSAAIDQASGIECLIE